MRSCRKAEFASMSSSIASKASSAPVSDRKGHTVPSNPRLERGPARDQLVTAQRWWAPAAQPQVVRHSAVSERGLSMAKAGSAYNELATRMAEVLEPHAQVEMGQRFQFQVGPLVREYLRYRSMP